MSKVVLLLFLTFYYTYADDIFYAVKAGVLSHSTGPISNGIESGIDINAEVLFQEKFLKAHPAVGVDINTNNDTSFMYCGLAWEDRFFKHLLLGIFVGLSSHNGDIKNNHEDKRQLGSRVLLRGAIDIGYYLNKNSSISFIYDHYSHLGLLDKRNQGNDNLGLRLGYYF